MRILALLLALSLCSACVDEQKAKQGANSYARTMYPDCELAGASCMNYDSDGDGYVSCTISLRCTEEYDGKKEKYNEAVAIECAANPIMSWVEGCRAQKMQTSTQSRRRR